MGKSKRMPNGDVLVQNAQFHRFGVGGDGGGDLIGYRIITITPEMVGTRICQFLNREIKTETGRASPEQIAFHNAINAAGGDSKILKGVGDIQ